MNHPLASPPVGESPPCGERITGHTPLSPPGEKTPPAKTPGGPPEFSNWGGFPIPKKCGDLPRGIPQEPSLNPFGHFVRKGF